MSRTIPPPELVSRMSTGSAACPVLAVCQLASITWSAWNTALINANPMGFASAAAVMVFDVTAGPVVVPGTGSATGVTFQRYWWPTTRPVMRVDVHDQHVVVA